MAAPHPPIPPAGLATNEQILRELANRRAWKAGVIAALNVATLILSGRAILLLAMLGATTLAGVAVNDPDPMRLAVIGIYGVLVILPLVWLSARR